MQEAAENRAACQAALLKTGVLGILIGASLGDGAIASLTVRAQARCPPIFSLRFAQEPSQTLCWGCASFALPLVLLP